MVTRDFEHQLIEAIQPIRHLALAHGLYQLFETGLFESLGATPGVPTEVLADRHDLDPVRLLAFLRYLAAEGYLVDVDDTGWRLTARASALEPFRPWYTLLVGGYAGTFGQVGAALRRGAPWADRDGSRVGAGSCGMSAFDAVPMAGSLLRNLPAGPLTVVDLGLSLIHI